MEYVALATQQGYPTPDDLPRRKSGRPTGSVKSEDFPYDKALGTRNFSIIALILCWISGFAAVAFGSYIIYESETGADTGDSWHLPHVAAESISLAINFMVTFLVESTGYIHAASLRWALLREDKLKFNSNLRLWSSSNTSRPNKWYANLIVFCCITLAYASSSIIFWHSNSEGTGWSSMFSTDEDFVVVIGVPFVLLGVCFLGLAAISTWAMRANDIPSWTSCPLDTALAIERVGSITRRPGRCMLSVHDKARLSEPAYPKDRQQGAWFAHWQIKWTFGLLWVLAVIYLAAAIGFAYMMKEYNPSISGLGCNSFIPGPSCLGYFIRPFSQDPVTNNIAIIVIYAIFQAPLTFGLHCAELQVNLSRDEGLWRKATTPRGLRLHQYSPIKAAFTSWQSLILYFFKTLLHWMFSLGVNMSGGKVWFGPLQLIYLVVFSAACSIFIAFVSLRRPKGPQPAAYGHLQTLVDLVDDWSAVMFWGHKKDGVPACHAGTAPHKLDPVKPGVLYSGLFTREWKACP
ncbi:hypothetical protein M433DRAFT_3824 [Acidomyces richmondensis BFW]|nr:MAG: hypothetical protein FE78DRAFT_69971 [Acidomyces sp. 'richmondensis']KYG46346.1 hypothetical protein M433DRAFT_3824 [Acidomyces richmondensis BFW]